MWHLLFDVVALLTAALAAGAVLARLGQSPIPGYLLAGMLIGGPGSLRIVRTEREIEAIAELGVALLLFSLGLEFSWRRLRALGRKTIFAGVAQVAGTTAIAAAVAAPALGLHQAVAVGAMLALSSTACVLRVLIDRAEVDDPHGRRAVAVLLVQDIAVVPLAVLVTILGGAQSGWGTVLEVGRIVLLAAALVAALYVIVNKVVVRAMNALTFERTRELTVLLAVIIGLGTAGAAHAAGISPALGAFLAGMLLGASAFATQIRADVASLRVVLLTLFFGAAGMTASPIWIVQHLPLVLGLSAAIVAGKAILAWAALRVFGVPNRVAGAAGLSLAQIGEFAFVLAGTGLASGVVSEETGTLVVSCALVTLLVTPYLVTLAPRASAFVFRRGEPIEAQRSTAPPDVLIVGFGPAGRGVARALAGRPERALVIDLNQEAVRPAAELGLRTEVGDATQFDVLDHARVREVKLVVIAIPSQSTASVILQHVRRAAPHVPVIVRSRYARHSDEFRALGAQAVVGDEEQAAAELGRAALRILGG